MSNNQSDLKSEMTAVKTGYARVALVLLAANMLLTGYCIVKLTAPNAEATQQARQAGEPATNTSDANSTDYQQ